MTGIDDFKDEREKLNDQLMEKADLTMKRIMNLDTQAYGEGALPKQTKEMLGLVASLVLRCDDCISHHLIKCHECGVSEDELMEALSIGVLIGGSITFPHVRRAMKFWEELK